MNQDLDNPSGTFAEFMENVKRKIEREEQKHGDTTKWDTRIMIDKFWIEFHNFNTSISYGNVKRAIDECIETAAKAYIVSVSLKKRGIK